MRARLTLEYWKDGIWYVGRVLEIPQVFSQGITLEDLWESVQDACETMVDPEGAVPWDQWSLSLRTRYCARRDGTQ
jgi:predicted RNase H-like HicB family nuclease